MQTVVRIEGEHFEKWWPQISEQLDTIEPLWDRWWTKEALYTATQNGWVQCWGSVVDEAMRIVLFTTVNEYPTNRMVRSVLMFGRGIDEQLPMIDAAVENFGREIGATMMEVTGRRGWEPKLKRLGYEFQQITMFKAITARRH